MPQGIPQSRWFDKTPFATYNLWVKSSHSKPPVSVFLAATVVVFFLALSAADSVGFVPYYIDGSEPRPKVSIADLPELGEEEISLPAEEEEGVAPSRIRIPAIDLDLPVLNPSTRDIAALDAVLKDGPARYVDSALLGEKGNVLIFGHSSHLPVVHNQMYKAFNRIPDLEEGDTIEVEGEGKVYTYRVLEVRGVDAEEGIIDLSREGNRLTIVTCDTLTSKSARFVVDAELIGSYAL
jgi:LPXTG-site transpeptidase (sortase) family protein